MESLRVSRFRAHYQLQRTAARERARLDDIFDEMAGDSLAIALERLGIDRHEEICLRSVRSLVRVRLASTDTAIGARWSAAIVDAISRAITDAYPGVVRYPSRACALADMVRSVVRGETSRVWAWRQLGLWQGREDDGRHGTGELIRALQAEPGAIAPMLCVASQEPSFASWVTSVSSASWSALASAALGAAGGGVGLALLALAGRSDLLLEPSTAHEPDAATEHSTTPDEAKGRSTARRAQAMAQRVAQRSPLARLLSRVSAESRGALALLALLDEAPNTVSAEPNLAALAVRQLVAAPKARSRSNVAVTPSGRQREMCPSVDESEVERPEDEESMPREIRRRGVTMFGGVLFLSRLVDELGLPALLGTEEPFASRPFRWTLHRLACRLTGAPADDAGVLAFAGLAPDSDPTFGDEPEPSTAERLAFEQIALRLRLALHERIGEPGQEPEITVRTLVSRTAEILADPGWIEARYSLDGVSTSIRRAGLDLDPGYLPWLGVVMRFSYA